MAKPQWSLKKIKQDCGILLSGMPRLVEPGRRVMIIDRRGRVAIVFRVRQMERHPYRLSNGKICNGCFISADARSARRGSGKTIGGTWHAPGAKRYFHRLSGKLVIVNDPTTGTTKPMVHTFKTRRNPVAARVFRGALPGLRRDHPEARLVRQYVAWRDKNGQRFCQHVYHPGRLICDLFDTQASLLIEAKLNHSRRSVREAYGQLCDYRRHYSRWKGLPRLAVLTANRPGKTTPRLSGALQSSCDLAEHPWPVQRQ